MRAWVFTEDKLQPAIDRWAESMGDLVGGDDIDMIKSGIEGFLKSDAALKLRVRECEPVETPEPVAAPRVLKPDPLQAPLSI